MVSAWPEPPSAMYAEKSAGARDGMEAFVFGTTKTQRGGFAHFWTLFGLKIARGEAPPAQYGTSPVPRGNLVTAGGHRHR